MFVEQTRAYVSNHSHHLLWSLTLHPANVVIKGLAQQCNHRSQLPLKLPVIFQNIRVMSTIVNHVTTWYLVSENKQYLVLPHPKFLVV